MDTREYEALKRKVETLKERQSKVSGALENLLSDAKERFEITTREQAVALLETIKQDLTDNEELVEADYAELKGLHSWQFV